METNANPYAPPAAAVAEPVALEDINRTPENQGVSTTQPSASSPNVEIPASVKRKIRNCWIASLVKFAITFGLVSAKMLPKIDIFNPWIFTGFFLPFVMPLALTYGVYRKSRICAVLLTVQYVNMTIGTISLHPTSYSWTDMIVPAVFLWFFIQGIVGTIQYHRLIPGKT